MSAKTGFFNLGDWRETDDAKKSPFVERADLNSDDPYAILGLPAFPAPEQIERAYHELKDCYDGDTPETRRIDWAYQELRNRYGAG